jgi:MEMO1 family protein
MNIRKPAVAGQFYPAEKSILLHMLDELFSSLEKDELLYDVHIAGLIAPHAGYVFSGAQAAKAYRYLENRHYELVCIISPSHREYFLETSVFPGKGYKTPLGVCPLDEKAREISLECEGIVLSDRGHRAEHALEVQLPFVQYLLGNIPILPLVMGDQGKDSIENVSKCVMKLAEIYGNNILFIASSDLSHFHNSRVAHEKDEEFISLLDKVDTEGLFDKLHSDELEACGGGPILSILKGLDIGKDEIKVLGYSHSGQILHDNDSVVGYTSAIIMKDLKE